ncbi:MAG TPA: nuclear transport factor 2 family protein [Gemmatimonadales bacterium]|nr:nuclear transport factor 2 family protein [Gemmatimonadales bacterium]
MIRALLFVTLLSSVPTTPPRPADPVEEVLAFEVAACAAYQRNDARAIDSLVADGYILTDSRGQLVAKAADLAAARNRDVEYSEFRNVDMQVTLFGATAIVRGRTIVKGHTRSGESVDVDVMFTDTVVKLGGRWRLVAGHVNRTPKR